MVAQAAEGNYMQILPALWVNRLWHPVHFQAVDEALGRNPAENLASQGLKGLLLASAEGRQAKATSFLQVEALLILGPMGERSGMWRGQRDEEFLGRRVPLGF